VQAGYAYSSLPGSTTPNYAFQAFSVHGPDTSGLERSDPLYDEGLPSDSATGSTSSLVFIDSNVRSHGLALRLRPTPKDALTLRYSHIGANELRSPLQFGQATRVDTVGGTANAIAGVTDAHLSDDLFLEVSRIVDRNTSLSGSVIVSFSGEGIRNVIAGNAPNWTGGFIHVVFSF